MEEKEIRVYKDSTGLYLHKDDLIYQLSSRGQKMDDIQTKVVFLKIIESLSLITFP